MDLLEEFLALDWRNPNILYQNAPEVPFISEEEINRSHIYTDLVKKIPKMIPKVNKSTLKNTATKIKTKKTKTAATVKKTNANSNIAAIPKSLLTKKEQADCLKALQLMQSSFNFEKLSIVEKQYLSKYNQNRINIMEENAQFLKYTQDRWTPAVQQTCFKVKPLVLEAFKNAWRSKLQNVLHYPRHYRNCATLPLTFEDADHVEMCLAENVVQAEVKVQVPENYSFNNQSLEAFEKDCFATCTKPTVSKDRVAMDIARQCNTDVVISTSSLKKLINNHGPDYRNKWEIPVVIRKETVFAESSTSKLVIYIDKPFPEKEPNCYKIKEHLSKCSLKRLVNQSCSLANTTSAASSEVPNATSADSNGNNVAYNIWKMSFCDDKNQLLKNKHKKEEFRILVRCKIDAVEEGNNRSFISFSPTLENQIDLGARHPTLNELSNQWTCLFFKPNSILYRVRIGSLCSSVIQCERCCLEKVANDSMQCYSFKPSSKLGVLYNLISELKKMKAGSYILSHSNTQGAFVNILKECVAEHGDPTVYDLHSSYGDDKFMIRANESIAWCPIDVNFILPKHKKLNQMPGMFKPSLKKAAPAVTGKTKKKWNGQKKNKGKGQKKKMRKKKKAPKAIVSAT